jgi:hypothetical protein
VGVELLPLAEETRFIPLPSPPPLLIFEEIRANDEEAYKLVLALGLLGNAAETGRTVPGGVVEEL